MASSTVDEVIDCLNTGQSFIVEAGAGAGKTRTLVESLAYLLSVKAGDFRIGNQRIVCITYTNVAVREIQSRINHDPLVRVSTIHDFLWDVIRGFQKELRLGLHHENRTLPPEKKIKNLELEGVSVEYWQYPSKWSEGKLGHDNIISLSKWLFSTYPKLARLVADRYPVIFVDEYQDTHESTISLLLDIVVKAKSARCVVGLFGDSMQKIYDRGVGRVENPSLRTIQKRENFRCSLAVIELLNRLRPSLKQVPGQGNLQGSVRFFHASSELDNPVKRLRSQLRAEGWLGNDEKVLMLTRKSIAADGGWSDLLAAYNKRGSFRVDDLMRRDDKYGVFFAEIEKLVSVFANRRYGEFLALQAKSAGPIRSHADKRKVARQMRELCELRLEGTIREVIDFVCSQGLLPKPRWVALLETSISDVSGSQGVEKEREFLDAFLELPFTQVINFERYLNDETPFSTNHGVKGEEYDNVLVVIDDTLWNRYKFEAVLADKQDKPQYVRSLNLFYVSCSRARNNLVVLATSPLSDEAIAGAKRLFGVENVSALV